MVSTREDDAMLRIRGSGLQIGRGRHGQWPWMPTEFFYQDGTILIFEFFIHLGVYLHWKDGGSAAFHHREEQGGKLLVRCVVSWPLCPFCLLRGQLKLVS